MTPEEFGQKIKGKYPQYAGMDDRELAQKMISKYPEYANQVDMGSTRPGTASAFLGGLAGKEQESGLSSRNALEFIGQNIGPIAGGMIGSAGGPAGIALGAAAGRALQNAGQTMAQGLGYKARDVSPTQAVAEPAIEGATNLLTAGAIGLAGKALSPRLAAQAMRAGGGVPEKSGKMVLQDLATLSKAPSKEVASASYQAFEGYSGLKGLKDLMLERGKGFTSGELEGTVLSVLKKLRAGEKVEPQELYTAIQSANNLKQMAKFGDPTAKNAIEAGLVSEGKAAAEKAFSATFEEYKSLSKDYLASKAAEQFSTFFPLNQNQTVNQLRGYSGLGGAIAGSFMTGSPLPLALPLLQSPMMYGAAIRGANLASQTGIPQMAGRAAIPALGAAEAQPLLDILTRRGR